MASYLRPRRGQKSTAETQAIVLKKGEVFFEIGNGGTPTTGSSATSFGKIKMGDGTTVYANLGYFLDVDTSVVDWDNTGYSSATSAAQGADFYGNLNAITPSATLKSILGNIKALLFKHSTAITQLNNDYTDLVGTYSTVTLNASSWTNSNTYSLESSYPAATYDLTIGPDYSMTEDQYNAAAACKMTCNGSSNVIKALGGKPSIDIPVMIHAIRKA